MELLGSLFLVLRDLAILAAGTGIAWWAWDQRANAPRRRDEEASARMATERLWADQRQWAAKMQALGIDISTRLDELLGRQRDAEVRSGHKVRVHRVLHATGEPFLTFAEIRDGLAADARSGPAQSDAALTVDELRRVLIELAADGVIAQLEHDRYFIASDYDADEVANDRGT